AEDGIRDGHVTGVQTCALPISPSVTRAHDASLNLGGRFPEAVARHLRAAADVFSGAARNAALRRLAFALVGSGGAEGVFAVGIRSEERRVGKEGGVRCWQWVCR